MEIPLLRGKKLAALGALTAIVCNGGPDVPPPADRFPIEPDLPCAVANDQPRSHHRVNLNSEQESRAMAVFRRSILITAHDHCFHVDDFAAQSKAGVTVRTIKPVVDGHYRQTGKRHAIEAEVQGWRQRGIAAVEILQSRADHSHDEIRIIRTVEDIEAVKRDKKLGMIMSFEGGRPLAGRIENLKMYRDLGLREMQLWWAVPSPLKNKDNTLSQFGQDVIREMNRLGIVVDLSHMTDAAFQKAMEIAEAPVIISHCGVASVSGVSGRGTDNLSDDTIRAVAKNGGVMCMHFYEGYIHPRHGSHATVEDLVDHIDYIKKLVGADYIGIGTDYFPESGWRWIEGAETIAGMPNVVREMVRRGYSDDEIEKIMGRNLMRVYAQVWEK
jgi:membrane dipeptidase